MIDFVWMMSKHVVISISEWIYLKIVVLLNDGAQRHREPLFRLVYLGYNFLRVQWKSGFVYSNPLQIEQIVQLYKCVKIDILKNYIRPLVHCLGGECTNFS